MKKAVLLSAAAALALSVFSACCLGDEPKYIMLESEGNIEVKPNQARASLSVQCLDKDIEVSKKCVSGESAAVTQLLLDLGIAEGDILTTAVNLSKSHKWRNNSQEFEGYLASTSISVLIRDLTLISGFYDMLLNREKLNIGSLSYGHSDYKQLSHDAYAQALNNSNQLADKLLKQLPETKKEIVQISNVQSGIEQPVPVRASLARMSDESASVASSEMTVMLGNMHIKEVIYVRYKIF